MNEEINLSEALTRSGAEAVVYALHWSSVSPRAMSEIVGHLSENLLLAADPLGVLSAMTQCALNNQSSPQLDELEVCFSKTANALFARDPQATIAAIKQLCTQGQGFEAGQYFDFTIRADGFHFQPRVKGVGLGTGS